MTPAPDRHADERLLAFVQFRTDGYDSRQIAGANNVTHGYVRAATNRIRKADLAESGEPEGVVLAGYWHG